MDIDNDYMENLARAYNQRLRGSQNPEITASIDNLRQQISLLSGSPYARRKAVAYAIALKESSVRMLRNLDSDKTVTSYRFYEGCSGGSGVLARVNDLEVELFILLDTLISDDTDVSAVIDTEVRATALLGNIR